MGTAKTGLPQSLEFGQYFLVKAGKAVIFVTVGTHEQPFDRLIRWVDQLKRAGVIQEEVILQTGYSQYEPIHCHWSRFFPYKTMLDYTAKARIVITHGGPASFILPLQMGKPPVVVPRRQDLGEHVNDHQVEFVHAMAERMGTILPVYDLSGLKHVLHHYQDIVADMPSGMDSNNLKFNEKLEAIAAELLEK